MMFQRHQWQNSMAPAHWHVGYFIITVLITGTYLNTGTEYFCAILQMQEKKECNDVQPHIEMFANAIGSQNWQRTCPYRPAN